MRHAAPEISLNSFELSMLPQLVRMIVQRSCVCPIYRGRNVPWAEGRWELTNSFRKILCVPLFFGRGCITPARRHRSADVIAEDDQDVRLAPGWRRLLLRLPDLNAITRYDRRCG